MKNADVPDLHEKLLDWIIEENRKDNMPTTKQMAVRYYGEKVTIPQVNVISMHLGTLQKRGLLDAKYWKLNQKIYRATTLIYIWKIKNHFGAMADYVDVNQVDETHLEVTPIEGKCFRVWILADMIQTAAQYGATILLKAKYLELSKSAMPVAEFSIERKYIK